MNTEEIFSTRFLPLYDKMYRVAAAILGPGRDDAADAVQDAMVKIWKSGRAIADIANPEGYAMLAVRNSAIDIMRRRHHYDSLEAAREIAGTHPPDPDSVEMLEKIMALLPASQLEVIRLSAFSNLSNEEIATVTGYSAVNVRALLSRGRKRIKELYNRFYNNEYRRNQKDA